jgi:hypothetical protein
MKRRYLLFLPLLLFAVQSFSQHSSSPQRYSFTVYAEPQLSWFTPDSRELNSGGSGLAFNGGLNFDNFFAQNYAFSTGISINGMKGKLEFSEGGTFKGTDSTHTLQPGDVGEYRLQYINVPVGLKFKTIEVGYTRFYVHLGIDTYVNIKREVDLPGEKELDGSEAIEWYNLGYYIGGGIEYSIGGTTALVAGLSYNNGFLDITSATDKKVTTGTVALRLGIMF